MIRKLAKERIKKLFNEAEKVFKKNPKRAHRYVALARKIAMKANAKMPKHLKRKFCKHCYKFLKPGVNTTVRIAKSRIIYYCKECKKYMRIPIKAKRKISEVRKKLSKIKRKLKK